MKYVNGNPMQIVNMVIGANGGIGHAIVNELAHLAPDKQIYAIARSFSNPQGWPDNVILHEVKSESEDEIKQFIASIKQKGIRVQKVFCAVGMLHADKLAPEKKLEDLNHEQLAYYFKVNAIIPALWLKYLIDVVHPEEAIITCISARVGSINDNKLGGWYGYRASKAALNQLVKTASIEYARRVKHTVLVCYQPGTVDTALSKPFQTNVKEENLLQPDFAARQLISVTSDLQSPPHCHFIDWQGKAISW